MKRVCIVGAGPVGAYAGYLLAKKNYNVTIFEEHKIIGDPFQCTGLMTSTINSIIPSHKDFLVNEIHAVSVRVGPQRVDFSFKQSNIVVNRTKFDQHIAQMAKDAGVVVKERHRVMSNTKNQITVKNLETKETYTQDFDYLIGADGPNSTIAKNNGMWSNRKFWYGIQATVKLKNKNVIEVFPDVGTFGWIVPENEEVVRIGLMAEKNTKEIFDKMLKDHNITEILQHQGGLIPQYNSKSNAQNGNIYLVGDAALMIKNTSAGGIIQGLLGAQALVKSIEGNLDYNKEWRKVLARELWIHKTLRNIFDKFTTKDNQYLLELLNTPKAKDIMASFDREYPSKFILKLAWAQPRLLYFVKFLF